LSRRKKYPPDQPSRSRSPQPQLSRARYAAFLLLTLIAPLLLFGAAEVLIRLLRPQGGLPLFLPAQFVSGDYLVASPSVGARWFAGIDHPPAPAPEMFAARKPDHAYRVFVLGESAAAGFPYPRNVTFSRFLRDVLRDVLPRDSVEVVNLGIAATNSFAMLDMASEVADQHPDAVLIYAGHNEYYGALGAASRVAIPGGTAAVRAYLRLLRLRTVLALRNAVSSARRGGRASGDSLEAASLMEVLARDRLVPLRSARYERGARQFESNLEAIVRVLRQRGIPVLIASVASNLRDQHPFAAGGNASPNGADSAFEHARIALARRDTVDAQRLFARARDLDMVRFRAPGEFNDLIRRVSVRSGAIYVPVSEAFATASPAGVPGSNLFLEHVHPMREGQALIGRVFFETMLKSGIFGRTVDTSRLHPMADYVRGMAMTPFDERIALHTTRTLKSRWPFVPVEQQVDYRGKYVPVDFLDSLAFAVSRGGRWEVAKLQLAADYERRKQFDSAAAEYAGLVRDAPLVDEPLKLMARALALGGHNDLAEAALRRAVAIHPSASAFAALGFRAAQRREIPEAISLFQQSLALQPEQPDVLYQLTLAYGVSRDLPNASRTAMQLARIAPDYPRLPQLLKTLGLEKALRVQPIRPF
jgi:tetratricopeptide (TPR) repeat protein